MPRYKIITAFSILFLALGLGIFAFLNRPIASQLHDEDYIVSGCHILNGKGEAVKIFPYRRCVFLDNGHVIADDFFYVYHFDNFMRQVWKIEMSTHHGLRVTRDGKYIMAIANEITTYLGERIRTDFYALIDLETGKIFREWRTSQHMNEIINLSDKQKFTLYEFDVFLDAPMLKNIKHEISHANSFYEIPENEKQNENPAFRPGNYVVTHRSNILSAFIFDKNLEKILYVLPISRNIHDVHMNRKGNFYIYKNKNYIVDEKSGENTKDFFSSLEEFDPVLNKVVWSYTRTPKESFRASIRGTLQEIENQHMIFTDSTSQVGTIHEIRKDGKYIRTIYPYYADGKKFSEGQLPDAKKMDLTKFLSNHTGF